MGKKKRQSNPTNTFTVDSSESESSKDSAQTTEANKTLCPHISKSVEIAAIRKSIKNQKDKNTHSVCGYCKKSEATSLKEDGWVCLRCGDYSCGPEDKDHRVDHFKVPRSDSHLLALQINTNIIWCFKCEQEIPIDVNKKVQSCVDLIKKQFIDHLPFNSARTETDPKRMNGDDSVNYLKQEDSSGQPTLNNNINKNLKQPILNLPKVRGLTNLGNTCFFNSVLQCLAQTPGLVELLREMDVPGEKFHLELDGITIDAVLEKQKTSVLSEQLAQVLTEVSGAGGVTAGCGDGKSWQSAVNPRRLLEALTSKCPQFEGGDQHDAHELLRHLLDSVHTEDLRRYQKAILNHIGYNKSLDEMDEEKKKFGKKLNQKVCETIAIRPDQIFRGSLVSILECSVCQHESRREETFLDLSLPVVQEKAQPPNVKRKQNNSSPVEDTQTTEVTMSKHQLKKEKKVVRQRHYRKNQRNSYRDKKDENTGETTIEEKDKKDSLDGEQSDADVEDNEDNVCEDHKAEIVESGYSSEKQASTRGSPVTTQSQDEDRLDPTVSVAEERRAESGLGSIQELTLTIPEEPQSHSLTECTSQDSVRVNASNNSPSSDSQLQHDVGSDDKLPPGSHTLPDRTAMVYNWDCTGQSLCQSQEGSSVNLSVSPQEGATPDNASPNSNDNDNMSVCTSLPNSNDNMSVCNSLPENVSVLLNSPVKSDSFQRSESGSEERPESRMDCRKMRSSPVELGEPTGLDSGLLKLSLEGMTCAADREDSDAGEERSVASPSRMGEPLYNCDGQNGFTLVGGVTATPNLSPIPLPPPLPTFSAPYSFSHPEPVVPRYNNFSKYKIEEGECSLQSCLNQFTTIEMLAYGNKVGCDACTERVNKGNKEGKTVYQNSTKQLLICKLPPVMIFHLKRFQVQRCTFRKITRHVEFPVVLDISPFCSLTAEPILYSLYGVVEHMGTLHGGHYVAYVKVRSRDSGEPGRPAPGKWFYISDSRVQDVDQDRVLGSQAYLLFYERIL